MVRSDYRQAMLSAVFVGFVIVLTVALYGVVIDSVLPLLLAMFIWVSCKQQWWVLEHGGEEVLFGYDFSQGYTSLERGEAAPPKLKRPNLVQRWLQKRAAAKPQREQEDASPRKTGSTNCSTRCIATACIADGRGAALHEARQLATESTSIRSSEQCSGVGSEDRRFTANCSLPTAH